MTMRDTRSPNDYLEIRRHRYALDTVVARTDAAIVYQATSPDGQWRGHFPCDVVEEHYFLARLRQPNTADMTDDHDAWLRTLVDAMTQVSPEIAGFPDWKRMRCSDVVRIETGSAADHLWGVFQASNCRRL